ncbi:MAG: tRNA (adenosine(37)-N6)-threonylcarbamoyltransferase complex ATPase subunit type 1 TsaE [Alphaproteobacteria bacterium]|nr:tRNA (adenosine(37)-N6)-threonylcarbamoyltransferase complex ATPase subunit type 1 TsaE [Alphaproteobacteria bacterium]
MRKVFKSGSIEQTVELAKQFAHIAKRGDVFALFGTLGVGKSVFARAFVQELTGATEVPSPTFTLLQSYPYDNGEVYHFDLYRLKSAEEVFELGWEEALYGGISLVEWPQNAGIYLPRDAFRIEIMLQQDERIFTISADSQDKLSRLEQIDAI